jgi:hypothetical protein
MSATKILLTAIVALNVMIIRGETLRKTNDNFHPTDSEYTKQPMIRARRAIKSTIW